MLLHRFKNRCLKKLASAQALTSSMGTVAIATVLSCFASPADAVNLTFVPDDLVVSRSVYEGTATTVTVGQTLPGGGTATNNGLYPNVFNNERVDASFGVTSPIFLDQITTSGQSAGTLAIDPTLITTSFPSKSELALNLTADGTGLTFMGYRTGINQLDVSNSNTPGIIEPGNPVTTTPTYRAVAQLNYDNSLQITTTNAYPGNNGRAAILAPNGVYYTVGNGGNGNGSPAVTNATGVQIVTPGQNATSATPGTTPVGQFNITQYGYTADKTAKDNNFRGETIYNNTLYTTKGSGSNGINTVYQVGQAGTLPNPANAANTPITILPGFPTNLARNPVAGVQNNPFGLWFANANTLYVTDEGNDATTSTGAIASSNVYGGLQKWSLVNGTWVEDYVLQSGLQLGNNYTVVDPITGNTYTTATSGLRNLTGKVNSDGTVSLYAVTATISAAADQGADPNQLVAITDVLSDTTTAQAASEQFHVIDQAKYGEVLRGVSFAPNSRPVPEPVTILGSVIALGIGGLMKKKYAQKLSS